MRRTKSLFRLRQLAHERLTRYRRSFAGLHALPTRAARIRRGAFLVIELHNLRANFCRTHFLSCMLGTTTASGGRITATNCGLSEYDALGAAIHTFKSNVQPIAGGRWASRDEPNWGSTWAVTKLYDEHGISHHSRMQSELGRMDDTLEQVRAFRNYFAHRCRGTRWEASRWSAQMQIPTSLPPIDALQATPLNAMMPLYEIWLADFEDLTRALCR